MPLQCLIVVSSSDQGVSAPSFIQSCSLIGPSCGIQLASPEGKYPHYVDMDDASEKWMKDFRTKSVSVPINLSITDPSRYSCLLIPHAPGALFDLMKSREMAQIVNHFVQHKKPMCAVGKGVAALMAPLAHKMNWLLADYCMTGISLAEQCMDADFGQCPMLVEDSLRQAGAQFGAAPPDGVHVVLDRHLITGQNVNSSLAATQNLVLLCSQLRF